jgi:uncharacterized membrane protein YvlD (DUF360 family)
MFYIKSLILNFLTVFFADHILPGIEIAYYSRLPKIGGDIIFAIVLGFCNSLVFPVLKIFRIGPSYVKIGLITFVISFFAYSIVNLLPVGVKVTSASGYLLCSLVVWLVSYLTNHLEYRRYLNNINHHHHHDHHDHEYENEDEGEE